MRLEQQKTINIAALFNLNQYVESLYKYPIVGDITLESQYVLKNSMGQRRIADIWLALRITAVVFGSITFAGVALISIILWLFVDAVEPSFILLSIPLVWLLSAWFVFRVWITYYEGIVIDAEKSELPFPATDVENRLIEIITLKRFYNNSRREILRLAAIETVMNETRARRGHYAVYIACSFGSGNSA
jgi:hypothetical protein